MTKDKTATMSRELEILEEINAAANRQACFEVQRLTDELRSLLAAPVVERQTEPVYQTCNGVDGWIDVDLLRFTARQLDPEEYECRVLYPSPPAPVAVQLDENVEFENWWCGTPILRKGKLQIAQEAWEARAYLDKVKEMNYQGHASDCSTNNRGVPELLGPCDCALSKKMP